VPPWDDDLVNVVPVDDRIEHQGGGAPGSRRRALPVSMGYRGWPLV
jgi:hypothetical protein